MPGEAKTQLLHKEIGLSDFEFEAIVQNLGRQPTVTELGMFAVLWSEHCSYKSSKSVLKLFGEYKRAVEGTGLENAGVVHIGDGIGITFKIESHNHPSAVEPYEGAATGVGGIIRDILSMGARPIACLDSLRFGDILGPDSTDDRRLFARVVQGIGGYGNCIGVPTVAGDVHFHKRYKRSPIVNAMCVGLVGIDKVASSAARGVGNTVIYLGSATGRDGIHGATFASEILGEDTEQKRPNVQIGDPFAGKLLVEATLEALETGAVVALQDMGAAGLTCSTCEMSAKGGVGMDIDLEKVPLRAPDMNAYEIMLSETQERMLAVVETGREKEVLQIFEKWGLPAAAIGVVTGDGIVTVRHKGQVVAQVPASFISNGCPLVDLTAEEPDNVATARTFNADTIPDTGDYGHVLFRLISDPNIASKFWIYSQYDHTVQTRTSLWPGMGDAAVLALRETKKGIAMKTDCNARAVYANPYIGGQMALIEAARNVACTGARPIGATDCLNFGNPNDPRVYYQFREAVRGLADASERLEIPVISGNVSFYNETEYGEILPTPTVGVVGVLEDASCRVGMGFPRGTGFVYIVFGFSPAAKQDALGASLYAERVRKVEGGSPESPDLNTERAIVDFLVAAAEQRLISCAHDISEGGFAIALSEMAIVGEVGCCALIDADEHFQRHILGPVLDHMISKGLPPSESVQRAILDAETEFNPWTFSSRTDARLFGEMPSRVLIGVSSDAHKLGAVEKLTALATELHLSLHAVGTYDVAHTRVQILSPSRQLLDVPLDELRTAYFEAIPSIMDRVP